MDRLSESGSKPFDTLIVILKELLEKNNFEKSADDNESMKNYSACSDNKNIQSASESSSLVMDCEKF